MTIQLFIFMIGFILCGFCLGIECAFLIDDYKREKKRNQMLDDYAKYLAVKEKIERLCKGENNAKELKELEITKEFNIRADYNNEYVKWEMALALSKELIKYLKIESEVNETLKTKRFTYKIQFLEQVK